jgi:GNAT superfamily N-acetyltransferase
MTEDTERIFDCIRRAREMGLSVCISGFGGRWENEAEQYPQKGAPGITCEHGDAVETLLYRDEEGSLAGILDYFSRDVLEDGRIAQHAGEFTVSVDPARQGCGIGTQLLSAAVGRWKIDFKQQRYTPPGAELVMKFLQRGLAQSAK